MNLLEKLHALLATEDEAGFRFGEDAADKSIEVECAKPCEVKAMGGKLVKLTEEDLTKLATNWDAAADHLLKVGHKDVETDTPNYGSVTGLAFNPETKRLVATVVPTPIGVRKNREEGFRQVSMELRRRDGEFTFDHLSLLGAHKPAIKGLKPVQFGEAEEFQDGDTLCFSMAAEDEPEILLFRDFNAAQRRAAAKAGSAMSDGSYPIENQADLNNAENDYNRTGQKPAVKAHILSRAKALGLKSGLAADAEDKKDGGVDESKEKMSAPNTGSDLRKESGMTDAEKLAKAEADKAAAEDATKAANARTLKFAEDDAKRFLAANPQKIGLAKRKAGVETLLVALARHEAGTDETVKLASADGKTTEDIGLYALACRILLSGPEQLTEEERKEAAKSGADDDHGVQLSGPLANATLDEDGVEMMKLAQAEIAREKNATGKVISLADAGARVMRSQFRLAAK